MRGHCDSRERNTEGLVMINSNTMDTSAAKEASLLSVSNRQSFEKFDLETHETDTTQERCMNSSEKLRIKLVHHSLSPKLIQTY